jgi:uncharacterized membrane protein HdeD (DUF308 family)
MAESPIPTLSREELEKHSKGLMGLGIALVVLGFVAIALPTFATFAVETFVGCLLLFGGFGHLIHALRPAKWQGFLLDFALGAVFVISGGLLLLFPMQGEMTLTIVLAAAFAAEGIFKLVAAVQLRGQPGTGWIAFSGLLALGLGILIGIEWPSSSTWLIGLFVGIDLVFGGWMLVMLSAALKRTPKPSENP